MTAVATEPTYDIIQDTMMSASYAEARGWIDWIKIFTVSDLADSMAVSVEVAAQYVKAALWHGIIFDTGDRDGMESIFEYVPIPAIVTEHLTGIPEWQRRDIGCGELAPLNRGMPVRLAKDDQRAASTPGSRGKIMRREQRYKAMLDAVEKRQKKQALRAASGEKWERKVKKHKGSLYQV